MPGIWQESKRHLGNKLTTKINNKWHLFKLIFCVKPVAAILQTPAHLRLTSSWGARNQTALCIYSSEGSVIYVMSTFNKCSCEVQSQPQTHQALQPRLFTSCYWTLPYTTAELHFPTFPYILESGIFFLSQTQETLEPKAVPEWC